MKKKQLIALTLATTCVFGLAGCNSKITPDDTKPEIEATQPAPETPDVETAPEITEPTTSEEIETEIIKPIEETINLEALEDSILAVSLKDGCFVKGEDEAITITAMVHSYDIYDMKHIANLEVGNTILINGEEVVIETLDQDEIGAVLINGGIDDGGFTLATDEDTVYYVFDYNDAKVYHELGEITLQVADEFVFHDESNLENPEITFVAEDFLKEGLEFDFYFVPNNATIRIENGKVVEMTRIFTP